MISDKFEGDVSVGRDLAMGGDLTVQGSVTVKQNLRVKGWLEADNIKDTCKGMFSSVEKLHTAYPLPKDGWWALVGQSLPAKVYIALGGQWEASGGTSGLPTLDSQQLEEILTQIPALRESVSENEKSIEQSKEDLSALEQRHTLDKSALDASIAAEQAERSQTDLNLQKAIDEEVKSRTTENNSIKQALSTETLDRQTEDNSINRKIASETTARTQGDTALGKRIDNVLIGMDNDKQDWQNALRDEEHVRNEADTKLGERITTLENVGSAKVVKRISAKYVSNEDTIQPENDLELISTLVNNKGAETTEKIVIPSATTQKDGIMSKEKAKVLKSLEGLQLFGASDGWDATPVATTDTVTLNFPLMEQGADGSYSQSDTGANYTLNSANASEAGLMSTDDKNKLDAMEDKIITRVLSIEEVIRQDFMDADTGLGNRITDETTARTNADTALGKRIDAEQKTREDTDTRLFERIVSADNAIKAETTARTSADKVLTDNLAKEVADRAKAITAEQTAREQADKTLQGNIDALKATATADANGLMSKEDKAKFDEMKAITPYAEDLQSYGIEIPKPNVATSKVRRIGNMEMHRTLPIQSKMRGCLLDDDGNVVEYLPNDDWTTATRDGSKGQVMVELPEHWERFYINEQGLQCVRISEINLPGYFFVPKMYISAYNASLQRSTNKLCSVVNKDADYRGGSNLAEYDGQYNSLLGMPVTSVSRGKFREYARNRNAGKTTEWNCYLYEAYRILTWFYIIEYADRNVQQAFNAEKTPEGFAQGGLNLSEAINYTKWGDYNKYNPFIPCGYTDEFGNRSGAKQLTISDNADFTHTRWVPRYRGVESFFADLWLWCDGINIKVSPTIENGGDNTSKVYVCKDKSKFNETNYDGYDYLCDEAREGGIVTDIHFGKRGDIIATVVGGKSYGENYCDYHYVNTENKDEVLRGLLLGGDVSNGTPAGLAFSNSWHSPAFASAYIGSRLCFSPASADHDTNPI